MSGPHPLTERERRCLRVIQDLIDASGGMSPTLAQIAGGMGCASRSNCHRIVGLLIEKGWVDRHPLMTRGIKLLHRLTPPPSQALAQLVACFDAGTPTPSGLAIEIPFELVGSARAAAGIS